MDICRPLPTGVIKQEWPLKVKIFIIFLIFLLGILTLLKPKPKTPLAVTDEKNHILYDRYQKKKLTSPTLTQVWMTEASCYDPHCLPLIRSIKMGDFSDNPALKKKVSACLHPSLEHPSNIHCIVKLFGGPNKENGKNFNFLIPVPKTQIKEFRGLKLDLFHQSIGESTCFSLSAPREKNHDKNSAKYCISTSKMYENNYPIQNLFTDILRENLDSQVEVKK